MTTLIDDLYQKAKLEYLSDLRCSFNWKAVVDAIREIPEEEYTHKEWTEVYRYITENNNSGECGRTELLRTLCLDIENKAT